MTILTPTLLMFVAARRHPRVPRTGHRHRVLLATGPRLPDGPDQEPGRPSRGRLPAPRPALQRGELPKGIQQCVVLICQASLLDAVCDKTRTQRRASLPACQLETCDASSDRMPFACMLVRRRSMKSRQSFRAAEPGAGEEGGGDCGQEGRDARPDRSGMAACAGRGRLSGERQKRLLEYLFYVHYTDLASTCLSSKCGWPELASGQAQASSPAPASSTSHMQPATVIVWAVP